MAVGAAREQVSSTVTTLDQLYPAAKYFCRPTLEAISTGAWLGTERELGSNQRWASLDLIRFGGVGLSGGAS